MPLKQQNHRDLQNSRRALTRRASVLNVCSIWLLLLVTLFFATFMPLWLCVWLLIAHYTMLEARSRQGKGSDLYFQVTGDICG